MLDALRRYWIGVAVTIVLGAASAYGLSASRPVLYQAQTRVFLQDANILQRVDERGTGLTDADRFVRNAVEIAESNRVAQAAHDRVAPGTDVDVFKSRYEVLASSEDEDSFIVTASAGEPALAVSYAEGVIAAYREIAAEQLRGPLEAALADQTERLQIVDGRLRELERAVGDDEPTSGQQRQLDQAAVDVASLSQRIGELQAQLLALGDGVRLVDTTPLPEEPVQPRPVRAAAAGALLATMLAAAVAWWRAGRTQEVESRHDAGRVLGSPLLGEVPEFSEAGVSGLVPAATAPFSQAGEAYQFLVSSLLYVLPRKSGASVLITSAAPGDGKSITALNLSIAVHRDDLAVVLVDADDRVRGLTRLCEVENRAIGLTDLDNQGVDLLDAEHTVTFGEQKIPLIPLGSRQSPGAFFRTAGFRTALSRVKESAGLVIVDSPPLLAVAETSAMAGQVDGIVLVVTPGTRIQTLQEVAERLAFIGTPLLGYVYNRSRPGRSRASSYGYGYGVEEGASVPADAATDRSSRPRRWTRSAERTKA